MAAWASMDDKPRVQARRGLVPVMLYDSAAIRQQWLAEQADLVRRGCCLTCGVERGRCSCSDYEDSMERGSSGDDEQAPA